MRNFEIRFLRDYVDKNNIRLVFETREPQELEKLEIKNIRFLTNDGKVVPEKATTVESIYLSGKKAERPFSLPKDDKTYEKMCFDLKQDGANGWNVLVDVKAEKVYIKESESKIL